jgi:hypothetical protein
MNAVWDALACLPRPVSRQACLDAAAPILDPLGLTQQFTDWFVRNGDAVLRRLNGG